MDNSSRNTNLNEMFFKVKLLDIFTNIPETVEYSHTVPIANMIISEYERGTYKEVHALYTDFITALTQKAHFKKILPLEPEKESIAEYTSEGFIFEPDMKVIFDTLVHKVLRTQVFQMILESVASEQSSRMVAMKNASEAAGEMIDDLTLVYNKARQASITKEISEISAGMASVS